MWRKVRTINNPQKEFCEYQMSDVACNAYFNRQGYTCRLQRARPYNYTIRLIWRMSLRFLDSNSTPWNQDEVSNKSQFKENYNLFIMQRRWHISILMKIHEIGGKINMMLLRGWLSWQHFPRTCHGAATIANVWVDYGGGVLRPDHRHRRRPHQTTFPRPELWSRTWGGPLTAK